MVVRFIQSRCVHSRVPWGYCAPGDPWVHRESLGSIARALGVIGFTSVSTGSLDSSGFLRGVWIHAKATWWAVRFIRGRWVCSRALYKSLDLSWVVGFTRLRSRGRWVHSRSLDSHAGAMGVVAFIARAPWGSLGLSRVFGFTRVRPYALLVFHSSGPWMTLGLSVVAAFNRCVHLWMHSRASWGSSWVVGFALVHSTGLWVH